MEKVLLSIICPAYNAENSIDKLINSIINQKFKNYELIIVNDGSTDNTQKVLNKYSKNPNIVIINKENTGVGDSRNIGINNSRGKYITFADADDYYDESFFEKIVPHIEKGDFELLYFNANVMNYDDFMRYQINDSYKSCCFIEKNGVIKYLNGSYSYQLTNVPWNKIFCSNIIKDNDLKYEKNKKRGQDLIFNILYLSKISKFKYVNEKLYFYELNMDTLKTVEYRSKSVEEDLKYYVPLKRICENNNIKNGDRFIGLFLLRRIPGHILNESNNPSFKDGINKLKLYLNDINTKKSLHSVKIQDFDIKLYICYIIYKLRLYFVIYSILWFLRALKKKYKVTEEV